MGESFKLHAQALTGFEDSLMAQEKAHAVPTMAPHGFAVAAY